ncbi:Uma2 family endonuclease [Leptothoe spongobia]|uniref:Uma2 family endonuclease n=1 Tax=Leptothoe spongobia TAU-MAC 1115 TaxID=1967444 RepID=A0A947DED7_9CYAN|nr:Uma2 family endonuclease [Leptothoe spongobia]MBT9315547.1 Uma2 family endonuclease [Leptothoe spongobia TAU-MAC 1115]
MSQVSPQAQTLPLEFPLDVTLRVTQAQFETIAFANRDLRIERSAAGELIVNPPTGGETGHRNIKIAYFLVKWIEEQGGHGIPFDSSTGFKLPNGADRSPDASWITSERWEALSPEQRQGFIPLCPDFVIELRSRSDSLSKLQNKMQEYMKNGANLGWLINPQSKQVEVYRTGQEKEILDNPKTLSGENVLPGFSLDLQQVWS